MERLPARPPTQFGFSLTDLDERDLYNSRYWDLVQLLSKMHDALTVNNTDPSITLTLVGQLLTASLNTDGLPLIYDAGEVTDTNNTEVVFDLTENAWDDLRVSINSLKLSGVKPPAWTAYMGSEVLSFTDELVANEQVVFFSVQMPHNYKVGSALYPHVHFVPEDGTGGNVRWKLTYAWASINGVFAAAAPIYVDAACGTTADAHKIGSFTPIASSGEGISSMLLCELRRNSSHANDTYNGKAAYLLEFDIHYEVDGFGSKQELVK